MLMLMMMMVVVVDLYGDLLVGILRGNVWSAKRITCLSRAFLNAVFRNQYNALHG